MGQYDFTYEIPKDFKTRIIQFLQQKGRKDLSIAFQQSNYEYEDVGNAYRAGIRGDNWNMNALDFTFEGSAHNIKLLETNKSLLKNIISMALQSRKSGFQVRDLYFLESVGDIDVLPKSVEERLRIEICYVAKDIMKPKTKLVMVFLKLAKKQGR